MGSSFQFKVCSDLQGTKQSRPTQHTQTFSSSDLSLAEEIVYTDNGTADAGGDTEHTPCAVDEFATDAATPPAGDNAARNLFIDFAYALSLGYHKEENYLLIMQME